MSNLVLLIGLCLALAVFAVHQRRRRQARRRHHLVVQQFPDAVDLLEALVRAGLTPVLAVHELAERAPNLWRAAFAKVDTARMLGTRLVDALDALEDELGAPGRTVLDALSASERYGQPLVPALERLSEQARFARRMHNDVLARRLPVRLSIPLVCCTLPSFVLLTIAPLLVGALRQLVHQGVGT